MTPITELHDRLVDLIRLAREHDECVACHCYRDVAERAIGLQPAEGDEAASRLAGILEDRQGTHG